MKIKIEEIQNFNKTREEKIARKLLLARLDNLFIHIDNLIEELS